MRITFKSLSSTIHSSLTELTTRQAQHQTRIATGKKLLSLSDAPMDIEAIVTYRSAISRLERYKTSIAQALDENTTAEAALQIISNTLTELHSFCINALQITNHDKWSALAPEILANLRTLIDMANTSHSDVYAFSGTKNTASAFESLTSPTLLPFELVKTDSTPTNPSGLEVIFKGNTEARYVLVGDNSVEQVSTTADRIFGAGGNAIFKTLIELYNTLAFNSDGSLRADGQIPTSEQLSTVANLIKQIADASNRVTQATSELAIRTERMSKLQDQIIEYTTRHREFLSRLTDTDIGQATMDLQREQLAFEYSLKVGARLLNISLIDFLR